MNVTSEDATLRPHEFYYDDLRRMEAARNYLDWQFSFLDPSLGRRILEIGSGIGSFTRRLAVKADYVDCIEPDPVCFRRLRAVAGSLPNVAIHNIPIEGLPALGMLRAPYDTVVCVNVLEHIEDDQAALGLLRSALDEKGKLLLQIPACPMAFGSIDRRLGHYRRYSRLDVLRLAARARLVVTELRFFNSIGVWAWFVNNRILKRRSQTAAQIKIFDVLLVPVLRLVERHLPPRFGQSLFAVLQRDKDISGT